MWSAAFTGRASAFNDQQRLLFPVRDGEAATKKALVRALQHSTCTGIALLDGDNRAALRLVKQSLDTMYTKIPRLQRDHYCISVTAGSSWTTEAFPNRIHDLLAALQVEQVNVLLLPRPQELDDASSSTTSAKKRIILSYWEAMCAVKRLGAAREIGVSGFSTQEMEFIFTAFKNEPPTVVSIDLGVISTPGSAENAVPFRSFVSFAHGKRMDVVARFAYNCMDELPSRNPLRDLWKQVAEGIAQRHRAKTFDVTVVHEAEVEPFHMEQRSMSESQALQSDEQILLRYLLQRGLVVVPLPDTRDGDALFSEEAVHEMFYRLAHPFTSAAPTHSPQVQYASVLSPSDMTTIEQVLPLVVVPPGY